MQLPHSSETDYRDPLFTFSLQTLGIGNNSNQEYGFYFLDIAYWIEILTLITVNACISSLVGCLLYHLIVKTKRYDTHFARLVGFGIIFPLLMACPVALIQTCNVRNIIFKFCLSSVSPVLSLFRTIEAIYGFAPSDATKSSLDYALYFGSIVPVTRDKLGGYEKSNIYYMLSILRNFIMYLCVLGTLQSIVTPSKLFFFGPPVSREEWFSPSSLINITMYGNSFVHATLIQMYLTTYLEGLKLVTSIVTGCKVKEVMRNPLLESTSPIDFWSRRWNLLIHTVLKGGVYKPVRKYFSSTVAIISSFLASGLFHEWAIYSIFIPFPDQLDENGNCPDCFHPVIGGATVFFLWQAALVAGEIMFGTSQLVKTITRYLPRPARTVMVIAMGIPAAAFFCEPCARSDFFLHGQPCIPMILPMEVAAVEATSHDAKGIRKIASTVLDFVLKK